ncbi:MAG: glycogen debranching protein GlgX [Acidocella sp.]|nr:glycogen debranching protein GlgX [Acidocella sp.]
MASQRVAAAIGRREIPRRDLPACTAEVFHGYLPQARPGLVYGYRVHGPYQPEAGHRFNPHKLLLDPYAKKTIGQIHWSDALFGYRVGSAREDLSFDRRDSAAAMPKAIVVDGTFNWGDEAAPNRAWAETSIYEAHVRGFTINHEKIPQHERGSFAALGDPHIIDHLVNLGITAIELLPVHAFLQDRFLVAKNLKNYWGYSTLSFFAPHPGYLTASDGSLNEIRQAVRRLHDAGIEVILDVVYNHTCEGNEMGPTLSWRGFDNLSYYRTVQDLPRRLVNDTGTGNTINITHPRVLQMVLDSLRYWAQAYRIDGFRFDLGSTLGRELHGFDPGSGFFDAIRQDPVLSRLKLISEPWDLGPGGYQLGNHPPGFAEWNDRYRDGTRRYWRGDPGQRPELAARLLGSSDIFERVHPGMSHKNSGRVSGRTSRKTWASINFIAAHDGFTLNDTVSFNERHNEANGEDGKDGHGENLSNNWGTEGPTDNPELSTLRERVKRSMLSTLFFSHGTPMLLGGDEMGRTQQGNNNAYCQDNDISWFDWRPMLAESETPERSLYNFTARLIALRRAHPSLRSERFLHGDIEILPGIADAQWFDEGGTALSSQAWADGAAQMLTLMRAAPSGDAVDITLLMLNASNIDGDYVIPHADLPWVISLTSADPAFAPAPAKGGPVKIPPHGAVLLTAAVKA